MTRIPTGAIKELISTLTVTDWAPNGWSVIWANEKLPFEGLRNGTLGAYVEMTITNFLSKGVDDYRSQYNPTTETLESAYYGLRIFTLSLDCRSFAYECPSFDILEAIRLRMNNPDATIVNSYLQPNGLSWIRSHPMISLPPDKADVDTRMIWRHVLDVEFGWLSAAQSHSRRRLGSDCGRCAFRFTHRHK